MQRNEDLDEDYNNNVNEGNIIQASVGHYYSYYPKEASKSKPYQIIPNRILYPI